MILILSEIKGLALKERYLHSGQILNLRELTDGTTEIFTPTQSFLVKESIEEITKELEITRVGRINSTPGAAGAARKASKVADKKPTKPKSNGTKRKAASKGKGK